MTPLERQRRAIRRQDAAVAVLIRLLGQGQPVRPAIELATAIVAVFEAIEIADQAPPEPVGPVAKVRRPLLEAAARQ